MSQDLPKLECSFVQPEELARHISEPTSAGAEALDAHLNECSRCQAFLDEYTSTPGLAEHYRKNRKPRTAVTKPPPNPAELPRTIGYVAGQPANPREWQFPCLFGRYELQDRLGRGGMGLVIRARDLRLNREVALKIPDLERLASDLAIKLFLREAQMLAAIDNPHVVRIYDGDEVDGYPYFSQELLAGQDLAEHLADQPGRRLPVDEVIRIGHEAALGLTAAHSNGIVHRDIKPGNLFLKAPNNQVVVIDFGLARALYAGLSVTGSDSVVGTPHYMAPEQARGHKPTDRTDLFSLGCVLYELLMGDTPISRDAPIARTLELLRAPQPLALQPLPPDTPAFLSQLILELLDKEPENRPSASQVVSLLRDSKPAVPQTRLLLDKEPENRPTASQAVSRLGASNPGYPQTRLLWAMGGVALLVGLGVWLASKPDGQTDNPPQGSRDAQLSTPVAGMTRWYRVLDFARFRLDARDENEADLPEKWYRPLEDKMRDPDGTGALPPRRLQELEQQRQQAGFGEAEDHYLVFVSNRFQPLPRPAQLRWNQKKWNVRVAAYQLEEVDNKTRLVGERVDDVAGGLPLDAEPAARWPRRLVLFVFPVDPATRKLLSTSPFEGEVK